MTSSSPTRVLHLCAGNLFGGVEKFLTLLTRFQHHAGLEHRVAVCFPGRLSDELNTLGWPAYQLGAVRISRPWTIRAARRRLSDLLARERFDVVVTHLAWPHVLFAPVVRRVKLPLVHYVHNPLAAKPGWLDRWSALHPPAELIGCSRHTSQSYARLFPNVPATAIHYPAALDVAVVESREAIRESFGASRDDVIVVSVSRMERWKGQDQLLRALATIKSKTQWRCWIVGGAQRPAERKYFDELLALREELKLANDRVTFLGERRDVPSLLAAADVFCQANREPEGLGIVFMEAFAAALPVVTMRLGPAEEIIADDCGELVEPGDIAAMARSLERLIDDPDRRRAMGEAGRLHLSAFGNPQARLSDLATVLRRVARARHE